MHCRKKLHLFMIRDWCVDKLITVSGDGLGKNIISAANRTPKISDDNRAMLNYNRQC